MTPNDKDSSSATSSKREGLPAVEAREKGGRSIGTHQDVKGVAVGRRNSIATSVANATEPTMNSNETPRRKTISFSCDTIHEENNRIQHRLSTLKSSRSEATSANNLRPAVQGRSNSLSPEDLYKSVLERTPRGITHSAEKDIVDTNTPALDILGDASRRVSWPGASTRAMLEVSKEASSRTNSTVNHRLNNVDYDNGSTTNNYDGGGGDDDDDDTQGKPVASFIRHAVHRRSSNESHTSGTSSFFRPIINRRASNESAASSSRGAFSFGPIANRRASNESVASVLSHKWRASNDGKARHSRGSSFFLSKDSSNKSQSNLDYTDEYHSFKKRSSEVQSTGNFTQDMIVDIIRNNFLFLSLSDDKIERLGAAFVRHEYEPDTVILTQGETDLGMHFFIIMEGSCQVLVNGKKLPEPYGTLPTGSSFGELSLLFGSPRAATVVASKDTPVVAYRIDARFFQFVVGEMDLKELQTSVRRIDHVINQVSGVTKKSDGNIIRQYRPASGWIRRQWRGTIFYYTWRPVLTMVLLTACVATVLFVLLGREEFDYEDGGVPNPDNPSVVHLHLLGDTFLYLSALTTFVLAFFLNEAYSHWKKMYWTTRGIQGRLLDISVCMVSAAERDNKGRLTVGARQAIDDIAQLQRLTHIVFWAKRKKSYGILLSPRGLSRMRSRGLLTKAQYVSLLEIGYRGSGEWQSCLSWMANTFTAIASKGHIERTPHLLILLENTTKLRALMGRVDDMYTGRCPIVYIHFVQLLVDCYVIMAPFALVATGGFWAIFSVAILTLFYSGLLGVAKMLLDPLDNDLQEFDETPNLDLGVLIRESNANSVRFRDAADHQPKEATLQARRASMAERTASVVDCPENLFGESFASLASL